MWIWPSECVVLDSLSSPSALLERISDLTDKQFVLDARPNPTQKPYEGWVEDGAFRIRRAWPGRRHSFRVFIEGRVEPLGTGSRLHATIHLDWGALTFFVVVALVVAAAALLRSKVLGVPGPSLAFWLLYVLFGALAYLMLMAAYWAGAGGARSLVASLAAAPAVSATSSSLTDSPTP